jgi:ribosomal protein S18 acetylase RimI-like enzyme
VKDDPKNNEEEGWEFGDEWKKGSPDEPAGAEDITFVEVLRGDTGRGFDDSLMLDLVGYLGSRGIRATYDSFSLGMEPAAIKTYVLKVEEGEEEEAIRLLEEKGSGS